MPKYRRFTPEYRDEVVKLVIETSRPIAEVARELGINEGTVGNWVNKYRREHSVGEELNIPERARLRELERENRELRLQAEFLKKSRSLLREGGAVSGRYALIAAEKARARSPFPVTLMCGVLAVSTSAFYEWLSRRPGARELRRAKIAVYVQAAFKAGRGAYGVRRVHAVLARSEDPEVASASPRLVRNIMAENGLRACQPRAYRVTTLRDPGAEATISDHLQRDFTAPAPGVKLVGDITYIRTWAGWLYLATVIDCHNKAVIGWSMAEHMRTELVCDALTMAAPTSSWRRARSSIPTAAPNTPAPNSRNTSPR